MTSTSSRRAALVIGLVALLAVVAGIAVFPAVGAAQNANESAAAAGQNETSTVVAEVDSSIRVTDYDYNDEREAMIIGLENVGDEPVQLTATEVIQQREGSSGTFGVERVTIQDGEKIEIEVSAKKVRGDAAVMLVTEESLDQGRGTFVSVSERAGPTTVEGDPSWGTVQWAGAVGILFTGVVMLVASWASVSEEHDDVEEVDFDGER